MSSLVAGVSVALHTATPFRLVKHIRRAVVHEAAKSRGRLGVGRAHDELPAVLRVCEHTALVAVHGVLVDQDERRREWVRRDGGRRSGRHDGSAMTGRGSLVSTAPTGLSTRTPRGGCGGRARRRGLFIFIFVLVVVVQHRRRGWFPCRGCRPPRRSGGRCGGGSSGWRGLLYGLSPHGHSVAGSYAYPLAATPGPWLLPSRSVDPDDLVDAYLGALLEAQRRYHFRVRPEV